MHLKLEKFTTLTSDVIFIDGLSGSGKSVLAPIIGGMRGVEKVRSAPSIEYTCVLLALGKLRVDAAEALLKTYADTYQYNNLIGREVNLRWNDETGARGNSDPLRYVRRLFGEEGESIVEEINAKNLALTIMTHALLAVGAPLFDVFGKRLRMVEIVRHPLFMFKHWLSFFERFGSTKEITLSFDVHGQKVPWFAASWAEEYCAASPADRVLLGITRTFAQLLQALDARTNDSRRLFVTSFEAVVFDSAPVMEQLTAFLGRPHHPQLAKLMKRQRLPRQTVLDGLGPVTYGWSEAERRLSERDAYVQRMQAIEQIATPERLSEFRALIRTYNARWPSRLAEFE